MTTPEAAPHPTDGVPLFEAWKEYQRIAMHFNDLLMRLRSQSLAAIGALASVAGFAFKGEVGVVTANWTALSAAFGALSVFWIAIWILDFMYYNRLLVGAVDALLAIEGVSANGQSKLAKVELSNLIENAVAGVRPSEKKTRPVTGVWIFYSLVLLVLLAGLGFSAYR